MESILVAGIFGGIAFAISFVVAFGVLKLMKVEKPAEHKFFFILVMIFMSLAYVGRTALLS